MPRRSPGSRGSRSRKRESRLRSASRSPPPDSRLGGAAPRAVDVVLGRTGVGRAARRVVHQTLYIVRPCRRGGSSASTRVARSCSAASSTSSLWCTTECIGCGAGRTARRRWTSSSRRSRRSARPLPTWMRWGSASPRWCDQESGSSAWSTHLPLEGVPFRDLMSERLGLPVHVDNDANVALLAEHRHGAAAGREHAAMVLLGTGIGGGLLLDGRIYRGATGVGRRARPHRRGLRRPRMPGRLPRPGLPRGDGVGQRDRPRGGAAGGRAARLGARAGGWPRAREITGAIATELAHEGDAAAREALAEVGRRLGAGLVSLVNALNPEMIVIGGGAVAAGDLLLEPARAGGRGARAAARRGSSSRSCPPTSAPSRACSARRCWRSTGACRERPAGGLPHPDRQPRGRHAARAGRAARGRRGGLRGHPAYARAARPLRRQGAPGLLPRAQRAGPRRRARRAHARGRHRGARVRRRHAARVRSRATCSCAAAWPPGCRSRCCPGRRPRSRRSSRPGLPAAEWRFQGFLPRKRAELEAVLREPGGTLVAFESPRRVPATLAARGRARARPAGRRLPRADQGPRGGGPRQRRRARRALRRRRRRGARSCWSWPRRRGRRPGPRAPRSTRCASWSTPGAKPRRAAAVVAELTGGSANALYRALTD